jgi:hypothetical protein
VYERSPHPAHRLGTQPDSGCRVVVSAAALAPYPKVKPAYWVDLRGRLSNPAIREVVAHTARAVACEIDAGQHHSAQPARRRCRRLVDRLGQEVTSDLLRDSCSGISKGLLADRYGISLSSVERILRDHVP